MLKPDPIELLQLATSDVLLGETAKQAIEFISVSKTVNVSASNCPDGQGTPSGDVEEIWDFRWRAGRLKKEQLTGIPETIESLHGRNENIYLLSVETELGFVAIWFSEHTKPPVGIIMSKYLT